MKKKIISATKILFFLAIGVFFIWIFWRKLTHDQKAEIWESFFYANYFWIVVSILLGIFSHLIRSYRWKSLLEPMHYNPKLSNTFFAVMIGYLANTAVPRLGEITRCGILNKYERIPLSKSFGTVMVERSIDLVTFLLLFFINLFIFYDKLSLYVDERIYQPLSERLGFDQDSYLVIAFLGITLILIGVFFIFFRKYVRHLAIYQKIKSLAVGFWDGLWAITRIKRPFVFIFQSVMIWFLYYLMIYVCFFSLPQTSHLGPEVALSLLIFGSIGIMVVQGGIGIYPAIIAETLVLYGIATTHGYALGWLGWTAQTLMIVITGFISLILLPIFNKRNVHATS